MKCVRELGTRLTKNSQLEFTTAQIDTADNVNTQKRRLQVNRLEKVRSCARYKKKQLSRSRALSIRCR